MPYRARGWPLVVADWLMDHVISFFVYFDNFSFLLKFVFFDFCNLWNWLLFFGLIFISIVANEWLWSWPVECISSSLWRGTGNIAILSVLFFYSWVHIRNRRTLHLIIWSIWPDLILFRVNLFLILKISINLGLGDLGPLEITLLVLFVAMCHRLWSYCFIINYFGWT